MAEGSLSFKLKFIRQKTLNFELQELVKKTSLFPAHPPQRRGAQAAAGRMRIEAVHLTEEKARERRS